MTLRRTLVEVLIRLVLLAAALTALRFAQLAWQDWQEHISSTFDPASAWGTWFGAMALLALTGLLVGLASLPGPPRSYRWLMPSLITAPALLLLGHYVLVLENVNPAKTDLPWILDHFMFYMEPTSQFVLAVVAGFGVAAGFHSRLFDGRVAGVSPDDTHDAVASKKGSS